MLNLFKENSIFKYYIILFIILSSKLYSQDISNKYNLQLTYDTSNQWWSQYNNYGQKRSKIYFNYDGIFKYDNLFLWQTLFLFLIWIFVGIGFNSILLGFALFSLSIPIYFYQKYYARNRKS